MSPSPLAPWTRPLTSPPQHRRSGANIPAIGLGTWLGLQAFINVGVNMGLLPTKGLTLPLISYGRSSLIITMICIGLLLRIHHELAVDAKPVNRRKRGRKS